MVELEERVQKSLTMEEYIQSLGDRTGRIDV